MSRAAAIAVIGCLAALAPVAEAAHVAEVRIGRHPGFTRLVLELDAPVGYRLDEPEPGRARLHMAVEAQSPPRTLTPRDPLVRAVRVEPSKHGSEVFVELATSEVHVTEMILASPPRIVLDLRRVEPEPKEPKAGAVSAPPGEAAPPAEPAVPQAEPAIQKAEREAAEPQPDVARGETAGTPPGADRETGEPPGTEPAPSIGEPPQPAEREAVPPAPVRPPESVRKAPERRPPPAAAPPARSAEARESSPVGGSLRRNLGRILIGLGIGILLLVWLRLRSRSRDAELREPPLLEAASAPLTQDAEEGTDELPLASPEPASPEVAPPGREAPAFEATPPEPAARAAPPAAPRAAAAPAPEGLESRLAQLERRLEDLLEARERVERQIAAHTEELRVQRAAIARTQRVVRSLNRPESLASEPVPRTPERRSE